MAAQPCTSVDSTHFPFQQATPQHPTLHEAMSNPAMTQHDPLACWPWLGNAPLLSARTAFESPWPYTPAWTSKAALAQGPTPQHPVLKTYFGINTCTLTALRNFHLRLIESLLPLQLDLVGKLRRAAASVVVHLARHMSNSAAPANRGSGGGRSTSDCTLHAQRWAPLPQLHQTNTPLFKGPPWPQGPQELQQAPGHSVLRTIAAEA